MTHKLQLSKYYKCRRHNSSKGKRKEENYLQVRLEKGEMPLSDGFVEE